jgi:ABC-type proline/glycine betaine transport system permease subunit
LAKKLAIEIESSPVNEERCSSEILNVSNSFACTAELSTKVVVPAAKSAVMRGAVSCVLFAARLNIHSYTNLTDIRI